MVTKLQSKAVVFDIGNVLIEWQPERFHDDAAGAEPRRAMFEGVDLHWTNERVERGAPFTETIYSTAEEDPGRRDKLRMWHDRLIEFSTPIVDHSVRLMKTLQAKGIPVFSLTNFSIWIYDFAATRSPFLRDFDLECISSHLGMILPDPAVYAELEDTPGLTDKTLFVADDRGENIRSAKGFGWQIHLFEAPRGWAGRRMATGLLTPAQTA